ncbi:Uncharacterized protein HZ326_12358 [Fusarium oxysporum f. sp. albedinis]|nr:Uncharacterized protein HZ326_12358 [Fusarium oxysporum f. sp. albedinis]
MQMKSIDLMMAGWLDVDKAGQGRGSRKSKWSNSLTDTNPEAKWRSEGKGKGKGNALGQNQASPKKNAESNST